MYTQIIALLAVLCGEALSSRSYIHGHGDHQVYSHDDHDHLRYHGPTAVPHVLHDGHIADTHEVAAAKAEHYGALAAAKAYGGHGQDGGQYASGYGGYHGYSQGQYASGNGGYDVEDTDKAHGGYGQGFSGQYASGYGGYHGYPQHGQYASGYGPYNGYSHHVVPYHGPLAKPVVLHNGYLADTHDVAAAKAGHLAAVAKAKAHVGYSQDYSDQYAAGYGGYHGYPQHGKYASGYGAYNGYSHHAAPYHGPLARSVVLHNGYLADTHEVAAAKHHHLQALHSGHHASHYHQY